MALFLRGGVLATAIDVWGWAPETAILLAIASAAIVNYLGSAFFVFPPASSRVSGAVRWRVAALGVLAYVVLLRLVFGATLDLIPEEAYYWNYSQHLDFGYLDHPPMVAWLIWLGSKFAGDTEFAVRIGAFLSWSIAAFFCYQLTRNIYGKTAALVAVLLFCILPFFFATGILMTPDAPLTAAWGGALYFLERALIGNRRAAWWGVGVCVGLGMLSKYTIALLAPATLLFILPDPGSRRWLWQPGPYVAALVATLFFSPVIVWNALNDWASFAFQSTGRLEASLDFSLHVLLGSILLLLTPVGIASVATQFFSRGNRQGIGWLADRRTAFIAIYTLVPLSIFVVFSLFHEVKLNWTGPLWLAVLPAISRSLAGESTASQVPTFNSAWRATIVIALLIYGAVFHYMALRVPDIGNLSLKTLPIAWEEFGEQVEKIETDLQNATGEEPLRVGMDGYYLSSEAAFYDSGKDGVENTAGPSLFGMESLMFQYWITPAEARGRNIILLSLKPGGAIAISSLSDHFDRLGPIREQTLYKHGTKVGNFYYRIGYDYKPISPQTLLMRGPPIGE
jgi:dolichol-phosphate mannosyltransferase